MILKLNNSASHSLEELHCRNLMMLGWVCGLFLFPFFVIHIVQAHYLSGMLTLILISLAIFNSLKIKYKNKELLNFHFIFFISFLILIYMVYHLGFEALFWIYPLVVIAYFVQPRFSARFMNLLAAVILIALSLLLFDLDLDFRFSSTLLMLIMLCDILVGELSDMEGKLLEQAIRDPLTNAHNRRYMNTVLEMTTEEIRRDFGPASLVMLDIDHFKKINDKFGHITGDTVLVKFVDLLHKRQRKLDYVFRSGGEEFVLLLRNTGLQQALSLAESLRKNIEEMSLLEGERITTSLGVTEYETGETEVEWLKRTDELLYEAKENGRNCVRPSIMNELYV